MNISSTPGVLGALTVMNRKDQTSADVDAGDGYGGYGRAPLMPAARQRQEAIAKLVLSTAQANVNARDSNRETPLTWPAGYRDEAVVKLLLDTSKDNVGGKDHEGNTVLPGPAANGHEPVV
jgi:ankyrin repeat protein